VIAVGAVSKNGRKASYSDFGSTLDFAAPSCEQNPDSIFDPGINAAIDGVWTTDIMGESGYMIGNYDSSFCGTSASAPVVSGVVGLLIGLNPLITLQDIYTIIAETTDKIGGAEADYDSSGHSLFFGYGRINAKAAIEKLCENGCYENDADSIAPFYSDKDILSDVDNIINDDNISTALDENGGCSLIVIN